MENGEKQNIVVIYKITYTSDKYTECFIPYYLSNGWTNYFRGNMLLPFFNFNLHTNSSCPNNYGMIKGLLFKINLVKNINMKIYQRKIISLTSKKIAGQSSIKINPKPVINKLYCESKRETIGVLSILKRISNLLDYFIATNSKMLNNDLYNYHKFIPVSDKENMYNPDVINLTKNYPDGNPIKSVEDIFRYYLIKSFREINNLFIKHNIISVEQINIYPIETTYQDFNNHIALCKDHNLDPDKMKNFSKYSYISKTLVEIIKFKIKNVLNELKKIRTTENKDKEKILNEFKFYLHNESVTTPNKNIEDWGASCKKKYLKYKTKYLNLKKTIQEQTIQE